LAAINVEADCENYYSENGILYKKVGKAKPKQTLICYPPAKKGASFKMPDETEQLSSTGAFAFNKELTAVTLSPSIRGMSQYTFEGCTNLQSITLLNPKQVLNVYLGNESTQPFWGVDLSKLTIYVPAAFLEKYNSKDNDSQGWWSYNKTVKIVAGGF
jgi:hypothetical protein